MEDYIRIQALKFPGKNPDLKAVESFIRETMEPEYTIVETGDVVKIGSKFASEYCGSTYTKKLRGALLKAKANAATGLPEIIVNAKNKRWIENKAEKHGNNAKGGWYRYDVRFSIPVLDNNENIVRENLYTATLVARINDMGVYLYDMINIKKEASKPFES